MWKDFNIYFQIADGWNQLFYTQPDDNIKSKYSLTFLFARVACHFLFTSTQFARLFSSKLSKMLSLNVGKRSKMVSIVKFCEFWTFLFFTCDFKCLFGFRLEPIFSPLDRMIWAFTEFNFFTHIQKLPRKKNRIFISSYDNFYFHNCTYI